ncbi:MAG: SUMF1/EgtB/PvdO family nonheme iron enzyme, partial [Roseiflexaceae bacterium]|nr:SUMF1/EgtB/PvdO family nonheme iron enzyme [Roseiflexaceae bacterium]
GTYPIAGGKAKIRLNAFRIARYPVTIWQYRQFVAAGGYDDRRWWTEEGWTWLQPDSVRYDWREQGRITKPYRWDDPDWTADNQPVIGVSWYEAMAFCNWLNRQVTLPEGWEIGLPGEAEWEVAAMWDADAEVMRAWQPPANELWQNVEEAGIGRTCPVGLFPQGASPCGALDMAGNVWEWCASPNKGYPAQANERPDDFSPSLIGPALRGGTYWDGNDRSGWDARYSDNPSVQSANWGFRILIRSRFVH